MPTAPLFADAALLPGGWARDVTVTLDGGRIATVVADTPAPRDAIRTGLLLPALTNLHSHTFQRAMAGLAERQSPGGRDTFWTWRTLMYRFLDRLSPDDVEAIAAQAMVEGAEAGYGGWVEFHYLHNAVGGTAYADRAELSHRIQAAAEAAGMGLTLLPVLYRQGGADGRALEGGQTRFALTPEAFADLLQTLVPRRPDDVFGVAPHSLRAVAADDIARCLALAGRRPIHIHAAEQTAEVAEIEAHLGARPVEWLLDHADIDTRWCLIHATHMTADETRRLAASGAVAGLCPVTEANLGDGVFPAPDYLGQGGRFGIGSDSNVEIAPAAELRMMEYAQRLGLRARAVLTDPGASTAARLYQGALQGGAQAAGRVSGAIAEGAWADLLSLAPWHPALAGKTGDAVLDSLVFAHGDRAVDRVWSAGRLMVEGGRHVAREAVAARFTAVMSRLAVAL